MALSVYKSVILSSFVVSGAINTLSTKYYFLHYIEL